METPELLEKARKLFRKEGNIIEPEVKGKIYFIGDLHGDFKTLKEILEKYYHTEENTMVFLGDYVDRGSRSREVVELLLEKKLENPRNFFLLQGNHEGYKHQRLTPSNFWESLGRDEKTAFENTLSSMPLAFSWDGLLAVHGGLPEISSVENFQEIEGGSPNWRRTVWGDFGERINPSRPVTGQKDFEIKMETLSKTVLIRAHQDGFPVKMFGGRLITLMTSNFCISDKRIAKIDTRKFRRAEDVEIIRIQ